MAGVAIFLAATSGFAAELKFDLTRFPLNQSPTGFTSAVTGHGPPGDWRIIEEEISPVNPVESRNNPINKRRVIAQVGQDPTDERFPLLIYDGETFGDFTLTTRFKIVGGAIEQMAGIAFRVQDEKNYYVARASSAGHSFRFYKIVNGERSPPIGPELEIPRGVWHELAIECKGNRIRCLLDGKETIPMLTDNSFSTGRVGFWTKSDSVSYFADTQITYVPLERLAQKLIQSMMHEYPRFLALKISAYNAAGQLQVIGSNNEKEVGSPGGNAEEQVIKTGLIFHGKGKQTVTVVLPLRDRNGDTVGALRATMKQFPGQTEQNAVARVLPVSKAMDAQIQSSKDLLQ